jgi:hypothetical protein
MSIIFSRKNFLWASISLFLFLLVAPVALSLISVEKASADAACYSNGSVIDCSTNTNQTLDPNKCYNLTFSSSTGGTPGYTASEIPCVASWIDASRIEYKGVIYTDPRWDSTAVFGAPGSSYKGDNNHKDLFDDECSSFFDIKGSKIYVNKGDDVGFNPTADNKANAHFYERIKTRTNGCEEINDVIVPLGNGSNQNIWFYKSGDQLINVFGLADQNEGDVFGPYEAIYADEPNVYYNSNLTGTRSTITLNSAGTSAEWILRMLKTDKELVNINNSSESSIISSTPVTILIGAEDSIPDSFGDDIAGLQQSCETVGGVFSFGLCPLLDGANSAIQTLDGYIRKSLEVKPDYYENAKIKAVWGRFRNIAYILLIPIMLIMVIATALGFKGIDAYTVKRAMPRLLAAVIFMALSYDIAVIMIEITNGVGRSVGGLIAGPFGGTKALQFDALFNPNAISGALGVGLLSAVAIISMTPALIGATALYLGTAALALIIIFAILTIRELVIVFLIIMSPVAILSWIFPGNDKLWKLWWNSFSKLLLLFPLIVGALMTGRAFASIANEIPVSGVEALFMVLVKITAYIGPFFFIPKLFAIAGGAFGNLAGMVNDRSKGVFDRSRKKRAEIRQKAKKDLYGGNYFKGPRGKRYNDSLQRAAHLPGALKRLSFITGSGGSRKAMLDEMIGTTGNKTDEESMKENETLQKLASDDDKMRAAQSVLEQDRPGGGTRADFEAALIAQDPNRFADVEDEYGNITTDRSQDRNQAVAELMALQESMGKASLLRVLTPLISATGTGDKNIHGEFDLSLAVRRIAAAANGDRTKAAAMMSSVKKAWAQSGVPGGSAKFSDLMEAYDEMTRNGASDEEVHLRILDSAADNTDPYELARLKPAGAKALAHRKLERIQLATTKYNQAVASGAPEKEQKEAQNLMDAELAEGQKFLATLGSVASPAVSSAAATAMYGVEIQGSAEAVYTSGDGTKPPLKKDVTVRVMMDERRGQPSNTALPERQLYGSQADPEEVRRRMMGEDGP